jgi:IS5 family transposase
MFSVGLRQANGLAERLLKLAQLDWNVPDKCDLEIPQTKKGDQLHLGMEAHIGVDAKSDMVQAVEGTTANVNDVTQGHTLLRTREEVVFADAGYQGAMKREEATGV